jgi:hypothetical protein
MSINTLYNFFYGEKNSKTSTSHDLAHGDDVDEAASDEIVDENGFVMIDIGDKERQRCIQVFKLILCCNGSLS